MAKWLHSLGNVKHNICNDNAFRMSCINGHLEIAQWLYSLGNVRIDKNNTIVHVCNANHLKVAKWLVSLKKFDIDNNKIVLFKNCISNGCLKTAKWLYSLGGININHNQNAIDGNFFLRNACYKGNLAVAKWVYSVGSENMIVSNNIFTGACYNHKRSRGNKQRYLKLIKWLLTIRKFQDHLVDAYVPAELHEFAFQQGYTPVREMLKSYQRYRVKITALLKKNQPQVGETTVFEIAGLVKMIVEYV
jgi:hypothetical protein